MPNFHVTENGPMPCSTTPENCPVKMKDGTPAEHFSSFDKANDRYQEVMESRNNSHSTLRKNISVSSGRKFHKLPTIDPMSEDSQVESIVSAHFSDATQISGQLHFEKGYVGLHVDQSVVKDYRELLTQVVGEQKASEMFEKIAQRPSGNEVHITAIDPKEARTLSKSGINLYKQAQEMVTAYPRGLGRKTEGDMETWFVVCQSPETDALRNRLGLPPKQYHITLGYTDKDLFTPGGKGLASILYA